MLCGRWPRKFRRAQRGLSRRYSLRRAETVRAAQAAPVPTAGLRHFSDAPCHRPASYAFFHKKNLVPRQKIGFSTNILVGSLFIRWTDANTIQLIAAESLDGIRERDIIDLKLI